MREPDPQTGRAAAAGDLDAFEELVRAYQAPVWRFLRHLVVDPALAEDLTQETFLRAFVHLDGFGFRARFSTWLFQIARNLGVDALRRRTRRAELTRLLSPRPDPPSPELPAEMTAALASLSPRLREALLLIDVAGLTYREAGATLNVPEGTVKSRVYHARRQLAGWFSANDAGDAREV